MNFFLNYFFFYGSVNNFELSFFISDLNNFFCESFYLFQSFNEDWDLHYSLNHCFYQSIHIHNVWNYFLYFNELWNLDYFFSDCVHFHYLWLFYYSIHNPVTMFYHLNKFFILSCNRYYHIFKCPYLFDLCLYDWDLISVDFRLFLNEHFFFNFRYFYDNWFFLDGFFNDKLSHSFYF